MGIFNLSWSFKISSLDDKMQYIIDLSVDLYYSDGEAPAQSYSLADRLVTNKMPCSVDTSFLIIGNIFRFSSYSVCMLVR